MYTDIVTDEAQRMENLILWSKGTHISLEAFLSKIWQFFSF